MPEERRVIIIGGGIAGLASAIFAIQRGWKPLLLEAAPQTGGRARSLSGEGHGRPLDNGQHVLSASYRNTLQLLALLGSRDKIRLQPRLQIHYCAGPERRFRLSSWPLPAPLHFLLPMMIQLPFQQGDRGRLFRWAGKNLARSGEVPKQQSVSDWFGEMAECETLMNILWEPLILATLNTPAREASAYLLNTVLQQAFLSGANLSGLGLINAPLSEVFSSPAEEFIRSHGGKIVHTARVRRLRFDGQQLSHCETTSGEVFSGDAFISAIPPHALSGLLQQSGERMISLLPQLDQFQYAPIITIYFRACQALPAATPLAFINSPLQWMFRLPDPVGHLYSLVISAAITEVKQTRESLQVMACDELRRFWGNRCLENYGIEDMRVIKEKRATILQTPAAQGLRPPTRTAFTNFFLAGDWIDTGLPATIESAVESARRAADCLR